MEVRACRECNSAILGARGLWTVASRKRFVKKALARKYKKVLNMPQWDDAEIGRLGPVLQRHVLHGLALQAWVQARIAF